MKKKSIQKNLYYSPMGEKLSLLQTQELIYEFSYIDGLNLPKLLQ